MGLNNCSLFCCALLCVHSSLAIILMGKRELVALLCLFNVIYLSKALTYMQLSLYKQKLLFIKEKDIFGHIVV